MICIQFLLFLMELKTPQVSYNVEKTSHSIDFADNGIENCFKLMHSLKALWQIFFADEWIDTFVKLEHPLKELDSMFCIKVGIEICFKNRPGISLFCVGIDIWVSNKCIWFNIHYWKWNYWWFNRWYWKMFHSKVFSDFSVLKFMYHYE